MKKIKRIALLLCLSLLFTCLTLPVRAEETQTEPTETTETEEATIPPLADMPFGTVSIYNGCNTIEGMVPLAGSDRKLQSAQSAFLFETSTETVVYSYNPDMKVNPGTLTKLVNAAVALEHLELDDEITLTSDIHRRPNGSRHFEFKTDEVVDVETLLQTMLNWGANDAAIALADEVAGNQMGYVNLMNEWVRRIGCTSTEFGNVHGLLSDAKNTTTARDMVKIMMAVMENEDLKNILSTMSYELPKTNKHDTDRSFRTTNYMIDKGTIEDFYDTKVKGGLASYEEGVGASIVVWATDAPDPTEPEPETEPTQATTANGETVPTEAPEPEMASKSRHYVGVVLVANRTFPEGAWSPDYYANFDEMTVMLKMGFNDYKVNRIVYDGMALDQIAVPGGECNVVGQATVNIDSVVPATAQMDNIYKTFTAKEGLKAPIQKGDMIGTVQLTYREAVMAEAEVYAMGSVSEVGNNGISIRSTATRSDAGGGGVWSTIGTIFVVILALAAAYLTFNAYMRARIRARRRQQRANRRRTR